MNHRMVSYILGNILEVEAALMLLPALVALIYGEGAGWWFVAVAAGAFAVGKLLSLKKPKNRKVYARDGFVAVALAWLLMSVVGAMPFTLTGDIPHFVDAVFETVSGFTTTGSSIMSAVEQMNKCCLFWRSFTHWIGGMGIFVFMIAVVPLLGGSTFNLMKAESPGPVVGKFVPKIRDSAFILYAIYLAITIAMVILLVVFGMPLFEALCHTFGSVGTGGFSVKNDCYKSYSPALQNITTFFMIACGINFQLYFYLIAKKFKLAFRMTEVRAYLGIIAASIIAISINTRSYFATLEETVRAASFQVGTIITTTGYMTTDFDLWPSFSKTILVCLMFIGACAGSTGGGIKVSRLVILTKTLRRELANLIHPRNVKKIQFDGASVPDETVRNISVFIAAYFVITAVSVLLVSVDGFDMTTNFTAVAATLNNIGPGLSQVGPTKNFGSFSDFSKCVMIFDMLAGRLEIFPMLLLLTPKNWKKY